MSYAPPGETPSELWLEKSNLDGVVLAGFGYGIFFTLFVQCFRALLCNMSLKGKAKWIIIGYITILFALGTIGFGGNAKFNEMTYIEDRNYPGGPNAFTAEQYSDTVNIMSFASYVVMSWFADGLVLYRYLLIWNFNYWMLILPAVIFMGSISMSISLLVAMTRPDATFWTAASVNFGLAYWSLSVSLNIILTVLIVVRLLSARNAVRKALGRQHSEMYTSLAALLVESASLYSVTGLVFIITYARGSYVQNLVLPPLGQVQGIAPLLIILRFAEGKAWSRETIELATLRRDAASVGVATLPVSHSLDGQQSEGGYSMKE